MSIFQRDENIKGELVSEDCLTDIETRFNQVFDSINKMALDCIESIWEQEITRTDDICVRARDKILS